MIHGAVTPDGEVESETHSSDEAQAGTTTSGLGSRPWLQRGLGSSLGQVEGGMVGAIPAAGDQIAHGGIAEVGATLLDLP